MPLDTCRLSLALVVGLLLTLGAPEPVRGATYTVPSPNYPTIQSAIEACVDGDEVVIEPNTYTGAGNRDLSFGGRAITVRGTDPDDPNVVAATVIDCQNAGGGFYFHSGEDANSVLAGLTITNGHRENDIGAIHCDQTSPTIANCNITRCSGVVGGIYGYYSSLTITDCTITDCEGIVWGAIFCEEAGRPIIANCTISGNTAGWFAAGIACDGNGTITGCTISDNENLVTMEWYNNGGGITCGGDTTITNCTITGNNCLRGTGAGITSTAGTKITNCTISGNGTGGSTFCTGGGIYITLGRVTIANCTITGNASQWEGGGGIYGTPETTVTNCILWGNHGATNPQLFSCQPTYNCIQDWTGGGVGNISDDPCFVDPNGPDGVPGTWDDNDYHLSPNSPCIDAGDPNGDYTGQADIDGQGRQNGVVDMGSDEIWPNVCYALTVTIKGSQWGSVAVDPEADANCPNLPGYLAGTLVTLTAEPNDGKSFKKWKVWDANDPNITTVDTNNPITIVMSAKRTVKAFFKCGGGGMVPPLLTLLVLGGFALLRRRR